MTVPCISGSWSPAGSLGFESKAVVKSFMETNCLLVPFDPETGVKKLMSYLVSICSKPQCKTTDAKLATRLKSWTYKKQLMILNYNDKNDVSTIWVSDASCLLGQALGRV